MALKSCRKFSECPIFSISRWVLRRHKKYATRVSPAETAATGTRIHPECSLLNKKCGQPNHTGQTKVMYVLMILITQNPCSATSLSNPKKALHLQHSTLKCKENHATWSTRPQGPFAADASIARLSSVFLKTSTRCVSRVFTFPQLDTCAAYMRRHGRQLGLTYG